MSGPSTSAEAAWSCAGSSSARADVAERTGDGLTKGGIGPGRLAGVAERSGNGQAKGGADPSRARMGVVIAAAGSGTRLGGVHKAFVEIGGRTLLELALAPFLSEPRTAAAAVALPAGLRPPGWLLRLQPRVRAVSGGESRAESVRAALAALPRDLDVIAVHDAARPLATGRTVARCLELALSGVGAVAGSPAVDSMKRSDGEGRVLAPVERENLWHAHTPQCFPAGFLLSAYEDGGRSPAAFTDDASLAASLGLEVRMVAESSPNPKITHPGDLELAEALLSIRS